MRKRFLTGNYVQGALPLRDYASITTQLDAVVYFMERMDVEAMAEILLHIERLQDMPVSDFMARLQMTVDFFKSKGDSFLEATAGFCRQFRCNYRKTGFRFIGNRSNMYMDFIFEHNNGLVESIYQCIPFCSDKDTSHKGEMVMLKNFLPGIGRTKFGRRGGSVSGTGIYKTGSEKPSIAKDCQEIEII
jgi:hypothetical protein